MDVHPVVLFIGFAIVAVVLAVLRSYQENKRRAALAALARRHGWRFSAHRDYSLPDRFEFLNRLDRGTNRYAYNVLSGSSGEDPFLAFDYHYETTSSDSKGRRRSHHHYLGVLVLQLPAHFPELTVSREGILSKLAQTFGYDDIDFESHAFSRTFCVRSADKKFAYDVCNTRMMEYLLKNQDLEFEIEGSTLAFIFSFRLAPENVEADLQRLAGIRLRLPDYLFTTN